ncbi:vWA domain-containing protein [Flavobacterium akiainvivens]|uniref:vWA domain-containing protein n=1 Tax=Flavobacterium akiainvivens TaxID=1202724 RepID=UPI0008E60D10|nr:von Willebrand factor type A domain-containing protein [Flavobacterium akiainvivens]SFQ65329.1 Ca-activated chloride channel family protein [Flavobacterium akiainvivens]
MKTISFLVAAAVVLLAAGCGQSNRGSVLKGAKYHYVTTEVADAAPAPNGKAADTLMNTEEYDQIVENDFKDAKTAPLSTFSIDVDNASYSNTRRIIESGRLPEKGAVRIEEFINYFEYNYPQPEDDQPFSVTTEVWDAPWAQGHQLVRIGLQGKSPDYDNLKPSNLVFLLDTSGSMESPEKLPLLRESFITLAGNLPKGSRVSIVTYAGSAGLVLPGTPIDELGKIKEALSSLQAGGSTAGGAGLELAYKTASENFIKDGNNRVILATDGDFNVGVSSRSGLMDLIQKNKGQNIFLTICGFGMGNYKDGTMEELSNWSDGNYFYIDSKKEADKVFGKELAANLFVIAKDVKIQVEFNPAKVQAYRLIGYENRVMNNEDFNDDLKDAGELGAGHRVTALYEVVPAGVAFNGPKTDALKYQEAAKTTGTSNELMTVKLRYKPLQSTTSLLIEKPVAAQSTPAGKDGQFVSAVAGFGMLLRDSKYKGTLTYDMVLKLANTATAGTNDEYKKEFISLVQQAAKIKPDVASR